MKILKRHHRILLLAVLTLALGSFLVIGTGNALESGHGESWEITPTAAQMTADGFCGTSSVRICRELCYFGQPSGDFLCFNN